MLGLPLIPASPPTTREVVVDAGRVVRSGLGRFFGIDLNYIRDSDANRPGAQPLDRALSELGVKWLRFPGGEKSNYHLWSKPPYRAPEPRSLGWYGTVKGARMDFDEFIRHARAVHAEPLVVVGYESEAKTGRTEDQWLEDAVAWVRYSREHKCGVRYWEIGNEDWNHHIAPETMAQVVKRFALAMKREDPSIRVGASGDNGEWWSRFLPVAGPELDFLTVSQYTGWEWKSYDRFLARPGLIDTAKAALRVLPARATVIVSETNTKDYSKDGWPDKNDTEHALVTFANLGRLAEEPRVAAAMVWTTRWMNDAEASDSQFYALDAQNRLTKTGWAIAMWGRYTQEELIGTDDEDAFAARSPDGRHMTVWILNRESSAQEVHVTVRGGQSFALAQPHRSTGRLLGIDVRQGSWSDQVPPLSVTAYTLEAPNP